MNEKQAIKPKSKTFSTYKETRISGEDALFLRIDVKVDSKKWAMRKRKVGLSAILDFKLDVENEFYALTGVGVMCPSVSDAKRAQCGIKTIEFHYQITPAQLESLGGKAPLIAGQYLDSFNIQHVYAKAFEEAPASNVVDFQKYKASKSAA